MNTCPHLGRYLSDRGATLCKGPLSGGGVSGRTMGDTESTETGSSTVCFKYTCTAHPSTLPGTRQPTCISSQPHLQHCSCSILPSRCASSHLCNIWRSGPPCLPGGKPAHLSAKSSLSSASSLAPRRHRAARASTAQVVAWWVGTEGRERRREQ